MNKIKLFIVLNLVQFISNCWLISMEGHHHFHFSKIQFQADGERVIKNISAAALFCEIKNFSDLYVKNDPKSCAAFLKFYFDKVSECVRLSGGFINKYTGTSFFAIFPKESEMDDATVCSNAVNCAFGLTSIEEELEQENIADIELAIGINYGLVAKGEIGIRPIYEETYIGDPINIASRLQSVCFQLNQNILISQKILNGLSPSYKKLFLSSDFTLNLKGRARKTFAYGYTCLKDSVLNRQKDTCIYGQNFFYLLTLTQREEVNELKMQKYVVLSCDIRNFTTYSERDPLMPDAILRFLNIYHSELIQIANEHNGFVYKILGDGMLVAFPVSSLSCLESVCNQALKCGFKFLRVADKYRIENGIGIDIMDAYPIDVGMCPSIRYNSLINSILLGSGIKRVLNIEAINKNPYIHKILHKHIVISDIFYKSIPENFKEKFSEVNAYLSDKRKNKIWGCLYDYSFNLPTIIQKASVKNSINLKNIKNPNRMVCNAKEILRSQQQFLFNNRLLEKHTKQIHLYC